MWKYFETKENKFIFSVVSEVNNLKVSLSDLKSIWREEISSGDILCRFKEMNPSFESNENIKESIGSMLNNICEASEVSTEFKDDSMILAIKSELEFKYNISFKFILKKLLGEDFFSQITLPMVQTILHLEQSQSLLIDLIKRKDRELQEYKLEKGDISREDLKTEPFDCSAKSNMADNLMLNLLKSYLPEVPNQNNTLEPNRSPNDHLKRMKPLKRKIYSAKSSKKKPI